MCRVFKLEVKETPEELEALLKQEKNVRKRERLQFLYWYKRVKPPRAKPWANCGIGAKSPSGNGRTPIAPEGYRVCCT
jgi:hypothetical protein